MREHETEKFQKYGSFFFLLLFGIGFGLPLLASLILCLVQQALRVNTFFPLLLVFMIIAHRLGQFHHPVCQAHGQVGGPAALSL